MSLISNIRSDYDDLICTLADYALITIIDSELAYTTARYAFIDAIGCGILALQDKHCRQLLGPVMPNTQVPEGAKVIGTGELLDPVKAAFDIGTLIRWLDYNDTWLAAEWGHPSDNLGAILAIADYVSRYATATGNRPLLLLDVLTMMIKAYEIQGVMALTNSFNRVGFDHVILVKLASVAVGGALLGLSHGQLCAALSQVWVDGQPLRTYRHAPNTGARKSWAAGDATSRAVQLLWLTQRGEMGYPSALTAPIWGFQAASFQDNPVELSQRLGSYVMENILFKIRYPAEFHAQTALECAVTLHSSIQHKLDNITRIDIITNESALRIIDKTGPLHNPADRDHCLQYIVAVGLLTGNLTIDDYHAPRADDPQIEQLRQRMHVSENKQFSADYHDPKKRSIASSVQVHFSDGSHTDKITVEYPIGHRHRRDEAIDLLIQKYQGNLQTHFDDTRVNTLMEIAQDHQRFCMMPVHEFMDLCT